VIEPGSETGKLAVIGRLLTLASTNGVARMADPADAGLGYDAGGSAAAAKLPDNMSGYLAVGFLNGNPAPMPATASGGRDIFDAGSLSVIWARRPKSHSKPMRQCCATISATRATARGSASGSDLIGK
jgi:hypothetical protein